MNNQLLIREVLDNTPILEKKISSKKTHEIKSENNSLTNNAICYILLVLILLIEFCFYLTVIYKDCLIIIYR